MRADVIAGLLGHIGIDRLPRAEPDGEVARRVRAVALRKVLRDAAHGGGGVEVERKDPVLARGLRGLFHQAQNAPLAVQLRDREAAQRRNIVHLLRQQERPAAARRIRAEEVRVVDHQQVVPGHDQAVVVDVPLPQGKGDVPDGAKARPVLARAVVVHAQARVPVGVRPGAELRVELVVGDDVDLVHLVDRVDAAQNVVQQRHAAHRKQGLWAVLCQGIQARGIPGDKQYGFHVRHLQLSAL